MAFTFAVVGLHLKIFKSGRGFALFPISHGLLQRLCPTRLLRLQGSLLVQVLRMLHLLSLSKACVFRLFLFHFKNWVVVLDPWGAQILTARSI